VGIDAHANITNYPNMTQANGLCPHTVTQGLPHTFDDGWQPVTLLLLLLLYMDQVLEIHGDYQCIYHAKLWQIKCKLTIKCILCAYEMIVCSNGREARHISWLTSLYCTYITPVLLSYWSLLLIIALADMPTFLER